MSNVFYCINGKKKTTPLPDQLSVHFHNEFIEITLIPRVYFIGD